MATVGNLKVDLGLDSAAFDAGLNRARGSMNSFAASASKAFAAMAAAAAAAFSIGAIGRFADEWSDLNSRLTNATGSADAGAAAMNRLQEVARRSYSSISQTTEAFLSQSTTLNALGVSTQTQLNLTETLNNALVISATRGDKARSVMEAWSKAMALGELRGDNLNSVIANSDRLAQALADSMGVSVNELRQMGAEGKITREVMLGVTDQLETLREEAENMPATISDGFGILRDSIFQFVGRMDQAVGVSGNFATMLIAVGDAITSATGPLTRIASIVGDALGPAFDALGPIIGIATSALAGFFAPAVIAGLGTVSVAIGTTMVGAVRALTAAMLANPLGLLIAGISAAVAAAFIFRDEIKQVLGFDIIEVAKSAGNGLIGAFDLAFRNVQSIWGAMPGVLGEIAIGTANNVIRAIQDMVNGAIDLLNGLVDFANNIPGVNIGRMGKVDFGGFDNTFSGATDQLQLQMALNKHIVDGTDYIGDWTAALGEAWTTADGTRASFDALANSLSDSSGGGGVAGAAEKTSEALSKMGDIGGQVVRRLATGFTDLFEAAITGGKDLLSVVGDILRDLGRMLMNQAFTSLLGGMFGGGGGGGFLGGLFGFARGGTIMPGGAGGIDSQLVMFRKSPNERVDITKPGQTLTSGDRPGKVEINVNVDGARGNSEIEAAVETGVARGLAAYDEALPSKVQRIQSNPRFGYAR